MRQKYARKTSFPLDWHKTCLENMRANALRMREEADRYVANAERIAKDCIAYDAQIIEAETRGVTEFDRERFGKKRKVAA